MSTIKKGWVICGNSNIYYDPSGAGNGGFGGGLVDQLPMLKLAFVLAGIVILVIALAIVLYFIYPYIAPFVSIVGEAGANTIRSVTNQVYQSRERAKERNARRKEEKRKRDREE